MSLETAKTVAVVVVILLAGLAVASAWLMRTVVQKVVTLVVIGLLALLVWNQRANLQDCADEVRTDLRAGGTDDTTCNFLGRDVTIRSAS